MELLIKPGTNVSSQFEIDTNMVDEPLDYAFLQVHSMTAGLNLSNTSDAHELCLVILSGKATIQCGNYTFKNIGNRNDVFEKIPPYSVYLPNNTNYEIFAENDVQVGVCGAPSQGNYNPRLITPEQVKCSTRGKGTNVRYIHDILPETEKADSLLIVEAYTPAGHWSSYPPHKHDTDHLPYESMLEEIYYHRLKPENGFAFQRVYTDDRSLDETMAVIDRSCVIVPRGYHPVGAPHGVSLYYLNVMAGPKRSWKFSIDPDFSWLNS